jgi:hypothetical protein
MEIEEVITAPRSPFQNPYAERVIGSIRRECLDHLIIIGEDHLRRALRGYFDYYHNSRPHQALERNSPFPREVEALARPQLIEAGLQLSAHFVDCELIRDCDYFSFHPTFSLRSPF